MQKRLQTLFFFIFSTLLCLGGALLSQSKEVYASSLDCSAVIDVPMAECQALLHLYDVANGVNWFNNTNRDGSGDATPNTVCDRYGISCNAGQVFTIDLNNNNLAGKLPSSLGVLTGNIQISLYSNGLTGTLPPERSGMVNLTNISLNNNDIDGPIPDSRGDLTNLTILHLNGNELDGELPTSLGNLVNLTFLDIGGNQLTGEVPSTISNWTQLEFLYMDGNSFTGIILDYLTGMTSLYTLSVGNNDFNGTIPSDIGNITTLQNFNLVYNEFEGEVPVSLANLINMVDFRLSDNNFTGFVLDIFTGMNSLQTLFVDNNNFYGTIPDDLGNITSLVYLGLRENNFTGTLPSTIGQLTNLSFLDLHGNNFSGAPLNLVTGLNNLNHLYFDNNNFSDIIFSGFFSSFPNMNQLGLIGPNQFSGEIPDDLFTLTGLNGLYLNDNYFTIGSGKEAAFITGMQQMIGLGQGSISSNCFNNPNSASVFSDIGLTSFLTTHNISYSPQNDCVTPPPVPTDTLDITKTALNLTGNTTGGVIPFSFFYQNNSINTIENIVIYDYLSTGMSFAYTSGMDFPNLFGLGNYGKIRGSTGDSCFEDFITNGAGPYFDAFDDFALNIFGTGFVATAYLNGYVGAATGVGDWLYTTICPFSLGTTDLATCLFVISISNDPATLINIHSFDQCGTGFENRPMIYDVGILTPGQSATGIIGVLAKQMHGSGESYGVTGFDYITNTMLISGIYLAGPQQYTGTSSAQAFFDRHDVVITPPPVTPSPSSSNGGGGGGGSLTKDFCPGGDYSSSYYDSTCGTQVSQTNSSGEATTISPTPPDTNKTDIIKNKCLYTDVKYATLNFSDIDNHRAQQYITRLLDHCIVQGKGVSTFDTEGKITRAELIKIIVKVGGLANSQFFISDLDNKDNLEHWVIPYLDTATLIGIPNTLQLSSLNPEESVTRAEATEIVMKLYQLIYPETKNINIGPSPYQDMTQSSGSFYDAILSATQLGFVKGNTENGVRVFRAGDSITRAELSKVVVSAFKEFLP